MQQVILNTDGAAELDKRFVFMLTIISTKTAEFQNNMPHIARTNTRENIILHDALVIIVLAGIFGFTGFAYSLIDFTQPAHEVIALEPFKAFTVQEIGGHFLFGLIPTAVASRNLRIGILVGLMALTIDADHVLNVAKLPVQGRLDHSIFFAMISAPLIGWLAIKIVNHNSILLFANRPKSKCLSKYYDKKTQKNIENKDFREKATITTTAATANQNAKDNLTAIYSRNIFLQFSILTVTAILFHIAYDIAVDDNAKFPLLNPFNFGWISFPQISAIPIEASGFLIIYLYNAYLKHKSVIIY